MFMIPKIYTEKDFWSRFCESYFSSFQAKMYLTRRFWENSDYFSVELCWDRSDPVQYTFPHCYSPIPFVNEILRELEPEKWYIVTIYNTHHQMFANPGILAVNFDIEKRELIQSWRHDQLYPGYPVYTKEHYYDRWGAPDPERKDQNDKTE